MEIFVFVIFLSQQFDDQSPGGDLQSLLYEFHTDRLPAHQMIGLCTKTKISIFIAKDFLWGVYVINRKEVFFGQPKNKMSVGIH